jgi:hypothetical protein
VALVALAVDADVRIDDHDSAGVPLLTAQASGSGAPL